MVHFPGGVQSLALTVKKNLDTKPGINIAESQNNVLNSRGRSKGAGRKSRLEISHHQRSVYTAVSSSYSTSEISWGDRKARADSSESDIPGNKTVEQDNNQLPSDTEVPG